MSVESVLSQIPGFKGARIVGKLADGATSTTLLVEHLQRKYVLRIDKPSAQELGMNRMGEEVIYRSVAAAGLAPELVHTDHSQGIFLRQFIEGKTWLQSDLNDASKLDRLASVLGKLHSLPAVEYRFNPAAYIDRYARNIATGQARQLADKALGLLAETEQFQSGASLCHNDLVSHNIVESDSLMLIDWEFAGMGDPWFDLATVVQHHGLATDTGEQFLGQYLHRKPLEDELERLRANCKFYAILLKLWQLRTRA